jgi:hypothetical protein
VLPPQGADQHPLSGAKALDVRVDGIPLIDIVAQRALESGAFGPMYIAGPSRFYGTRRGTAEVIDTEGSLSHNIRVALAEVTRRHPDEAVAFATCDIVPRITELQQAMAEYARSAPLDVWYPLIAVPKDAAALGASAWKPRYCVIPAPGSEPVPVLPGHLLVLRPGVLRLDLVLRGFELAYRTRNRPVFYRTFMIVSGLLGLLLLADLRRIVRLRPPTRTLGALYHALCLAWRLWRGNSTLEGLAEPVRAALIDLDHRRRHPEQAGRFVILPAVSLARDIDTREEAAELAQAAARQRTGRRANE